MLTFGRVGEVDGWEVGAGLGVSGNKGDGGGFDLRQTKREREKEREGMKGEWLSSC